MSSSTRNIIAWILQVLLGLAFIASGGMKFMNLSQTTGMFSSLGLPAFLAYVIAGGELLGGIGLLIPRFVRPAAAGLIIIMIGAVFMHATRIPGGYLPADGKPNGLPATVLLLLLAVLLVLRRPAPARLA